MKHASVRVLPALCLALLAGCSSPSDTGSAQLAVLSPRAGAAAIARVSVTSSGANTPTTSVELAAAEPLRIGSLGTLPTSSHRTFLAEAFDASGALLFTGSASEVPISSGQTALVVLTLQKPNAESASLIEPPVIDSLVASSSTVSVGGTVSLQATAHGVHPDDALTYAWSSAAGSFSSASEASTSWTAPFSSGAQTLTLTVTDSSGMSSSGSLAITVVQGSGQGTAQINVSFNSAPQVPVISSTAIHVAAGQGISVSAISSDEDGDSLSYAWTASCVGTWINASSGTAQFTPSALPAGACSTGTSNCSLTVTVSDGHGGQRTGSRSVCISTSAPAAHFPPVIIGSYRSILESEQVSDHVTYEVVANDPEASALSFSWTANTGSLGTPVTSGAQSRITWTAPACVNDGTTPTITATVTNAFTQQATRSFTVVGLSTCSNSDWASAGSMASARRDHTATLLNTGTRVLITGGRSPSGTLKTVELGNPSAGTWSPAKAMAFARYQHTATLLPDGRVLVAGGNSSGSAIAKAELYSPGTDTWSNTSNDMRTARYGHTAVFINGKVLVAGGISGGKSLAAAELFDVASRTWSTANSMGTARQLHTMTVLANGKVLVTGGFNSGSPVATAELYDPTLGTWSAAGSMASPRSGHTATLLSNGKVLISGGFNLGVAPAVAELYEPGPGPGTWSTTGRLTTPRANHAAVALPGDRVLLMGGQTPQTSYPVMSEIYDLVSGTWSDASNLADGRGSFPALPLGTGQVLVTGGFNESGSLAATELYTPPPSPQP